MTNLDYIKSQGAKELADLICSDDGYACGLCKERNRVCNGNCWQGIVDWLLSEREEELKPCPFCGGEARVYTEGGTWPFVYCDVCSAEIQGNTKAEVIEAWNKREDQR